MSGKDYPISCFSDAARSTLGGVLAFFLGLVGGSLIVFSQEIAGLRFEWTAFLVAWLVLLPYTVIKLWGLLLLPLLGTILFGLVWRDWNRLICAALTAIVFSVTMRGLRTAQSLRNPRIGDCLWHRHGCRLLGAGGRHHHGSPGAQPFSETQTTRMIQVLSDHLRRCGVGLGVTLFSGFGLGTPMSNGLL
jgi:hypothetical protein